MRWTGELCVARVTLPRNRRPAALLASTALHARCLRLSMAFIVLSINKENHFGVEGRCGTTSHTCCTTCPAPKRQLSALKPAGRGHRKMPLLSHFGLTWKACFRRIYGDLTLIPKMLFAATSTRVESGRVESFVMARLKVIP